MAFIRKENKYDWDFEIIGGCSRVKITKGEDIAHLHELDPKMWTVLSCPVKGLEIDEKSLVYIDADGDEELIAFLFSLGCYSGEPITVVSRLKGGCVVSIKDGRYNIDNDLAGAILV